MSIHVSTNDQNVVFGNESDKRKYIKGGHVHFVTGIRGIAARNKFVQPLPFSLHNYHIRIIVL